MKKCIGVFSFCFFIFLTGCEKKNNIDNVGKTNTTETVITENKQNHEVENIDFVSQSVTSKCPVKYLKDYIFEPIELFDNSLFCVELDKENTINISYDSKILLSINEIKGKVVSIINNCNNSKIYSNVVDIKVNENKYFCVFLFSKGIMKFYKSEQPQNLQTSPLFVENNKYLIFDNFTLIKNEYYDSWTYKTIPAQYYDTIEVFDMNQNETIYSINKNDLHNNIFLYFQNVVYENDGFRIVLGCYPDSDEFVNFKLFTDNNDFHYEIYEKYSYDELE